MNGAEAIHGALEMIKRNFYKGNIVAYLKQRTALTRSLTRYAYECRSRGWDLAPEDIALDLSVVVRHCSEYRDEIDYLPVYLERAVDTHVRRRAEEIQERSRDFEPLIRRLVSTVKGVAEVRLTETEQLAALYESLKSKARKAKGKAAKQTEFRLR